MGAVVEPIKVAGLRDLQRALKALDGESQKALRVVLNKAADLVATGARRKVPTRTGAAAASIRASSGQREASVKAGSKKAPYYGWLDYGGRVGRSRSVSRPFRPTGRYIYPSYDSQRAEVLDLLENELAELIRSAGLKVH